MAIERDFAIENLIVINLWQIKRLAHIITRYYTTKAFNSSFSRFELFPLKCTDLFPFVCEQRIPMLRYIKESQTKQDLRSNTRNSSLNQTTGQLILWGYFCKQQFVLILFFITIFWVTILCNCIKSKIDPWIRG